MKNTAIITIFILVIVILFQVENVSAYNSEIDAVRKPLENYLKSHIKGDSGQLSKSMHSVGRLIYVRDGKYTPVEFPRYLSGWKLRDPKVVAETRSYIDSIEITGNVAVAKLGLDYPGRSFTDYMTLLKIKGEWKIVNKIAYSLRNPKNNSAERGDFDAVKVPLENYLMGHQTGKAEYMRKAFYSEGKLMSMRGGKYTTVEFEKFFGYFKGTPAKDEAMRKRWIESIDVTGNVAIGKIILDYPTVKFTDYMALLKIGSEWKIVNKTFYSERIPVAK